MKINFLKNNLGLVFWFFVVLYYSFIIFLSSFSVPPGSSFVFSSYIKHFLLYSLFGVFLNFAFFHSVNKKYSYVFAVLLGFLLACFDEFYQGFVPGRTTYIFDALADTAGIVFTQIIILVFRKKV